MNKPFLFTENQSAISRLTKKLEDLKLSVHAVKSSESAYIPARMSINCPWMHEQKFEIVWNRTWRPDGMQMEDEYVTIEPAHKLKIDQNKLQNCRSNILNLVNVL